MSVPCRTVDDVKVAFQSSCKSLDPKDCVAFYDSWAEKYEEDLCLMSFRAPNLAVNFLSENFSGSPEDALVLDVACGSGFVAKLMYELGFRHFVGVDGSKGMLDHAAETGLYQDLRLALLGTERLPAQTGMFDVVIIVGALDAGFVPVSVVRELCHTAKLGGLICMGRGNHSLTTSERYRKDLEKELQLMEEEGLWSLVGIKQVERYMENPHLNTETDRKDEAEKQYISGTVYLYKKSINPLI